MDVLDGSIFEKAMRHGSTPSTPKVYLLGFKSLVDGRTWQEAATFTKAAAVTPAPVRALAASISDREGVMPIDAEGKAEAGVGLWTGLLVSAGVQGNGKVTVDA